MEKDLEEWVTRVSEPKEELGGFSICPFAKKGFKDGKVLHFELPQNLSLSEIVEHIEQKANSNLEYEVIAFFDTHNQLSNSACIDIIDLLNSKKTSIIYLKDHPDDPGYIQKIYTGNGKHPCILAQPKDKLFRARESLKKTDYYDYWSEEYKKEIWGYGE